MSAQTPGCGSNSESRKRLAEKASTPDDREAVAALAEAFKIGWHRADDLGLPDRTHYGIRAVLTSDELAERDARVRASALDVCAALLDRVVTYWGGRPLSAGHGVNLYADVRDVLRGIERDRDHNRAIARQSVEGGGER